MTGSARARGGVALAALGVLLVITASWWALALWPMPVDAPAWVARTRAVCFGAAPDGLPDTGGWVLLIGEPIGMIGVLVMVWGDVLRRDLRRAAQSMTGLAAMTLSAMLLVAGGVGAVHRVRSAGGEPFLVRPATEVGRYHGERGVAPPIALVDQHGQSFHLEGLRGRPVLVTFAYAHCQTVCPTVVHDLQAARRAAGRPDAVLVVVTLDPWRDVPARLPAIASAWNLQGDDRVLSGTLAAVQGVHRAWGAVPARDDRTGELAHVARVVILDRDGAVHAQLADDWTRAADVLRTMNPDDRRM